MILLYHERISKLESNPYALSAAPIAAANAKPSASGAPRAKKVNASPATVVAGNRGLGTEKRSEIGLVYRPTIGHVPLIPDLFVL